MSDATVTVAPEVAGEWPTYSIGELASAEEGAIAIGPFGSSMKADTYTQTGIPVVRGNNLTGRPGFFGDFVYVPEETAARFPRCLVGPGDLVFPHRGAIGEVGLVAGQGLERWMLSTSMMKFRPDSSRLDSLFAFYFFRSALGRHQLLKNASQVGTPGIGQPLASLRACELALPPLADQQAIASVLGALDDKIEQNRRTAQALERLARAIFRAWFVDFEPVKAKAAGATAFPSMPQPVFDALPTRFVDSDIGPVPEGWEVGKLGDHCRINQRSVRAGDIEGAIEYVDISSVTVGRLTGVQRVPFSEAPSRARRRVRHGDTIWSCVRPNHRSYLFIHSPPEDRIVSTGFAVLSPGSFGASFLHEITTQPEFVHHLVSNADGSAYPAVRPDHFASAEVVVPPQLIRDAFEELTMPLRDSLAAAERESATLAEMRNYLLSKLLTGEVRIRSIALEEAKRQ